MTAARTTPQKKKPGRAAGRRRPTKNPPRQAPAPVTVEPRENTGRLTPTQRRRVPDEPCTVQALCKCVGMLLPNHGRLHGDYPYVAVKITVGCSGHPERVAAGVIQRFPPLAIRRLPAAVTA
jgi:hypothetical protein